MRRHLGGPVDAEVVLALDEGEEGREVRLRQLGVDPVLAEHLPERAVKNLGTPIDLRVIRRRPALLDPEGGPETRLDAVAELEAAVGGDHSWAAP